MNEQVLAALRTVQDPDLRRDLVTLGMIKRADKDEAGNVAVVVELTTPACPLKAQIEADCRAAISAVPGVKSIAIEMTARVTSATPGEGRASVPGIKNIIAVASGKGGVGKSTTAVNLAIALHSLGARVALLDADIHGPNTPGMLGVTERPRVVERRILPIAVYGIHFMSMGLLVPTEQAVIWRGPMLHGALRQMLFDVAWGDQDYLIVDMPPGTGDVQLSLTQLATITGAVIVTTPQNVALHDVRKGVAMFQKLEVPILGIVENMSYYLCPNCGHRDDVFDTGGGERMALEIDLPFLGAIPLNSTVREAMDRGLPIAAEPEHPYAAYYQKIARAVAQQVSIRNAAAGPRPFAVIPQS